MKGMLGREPKKAAKAKPKAAPIPPARGLGRPQFNDNDADDVPMRPKAPMGPPPFPIKGKKKGGK